MPESIEQTQELLLEAKRKTAEARKELEAVEAQVQEIDSIHLNVDVDFPKTSETLAQIEGNVSRIAEFKEAVAKILPSIDGVKKGIEEINLLERKFEAYLKEIFFLDGHKRYEDGLVRVDELEELAKSVDFGDQLNVQKTVLELSAWERCCLYAHLGEHNVRQGERPMSDEQLDLFAAKVEELPIGIHKAEQIDIFRDKILGFRCVIRAKDSLANGRSFDSLNASIALIQDALKHRDNLSQFTAERLNYLVSVTIDEYNYLCVDAFDVRRVYEDAEALFNLRGYFELEKIVHVDYREATDSHDFKLRFLKAEALRMDDEAFSIAVYAYADSIRSQDEFEFEVLTQYLALPGLTTEKVGYLIAAINRMSFELMVLLLGAALSLGIEPERQKAVLDNIYAKKEKRLNLDNSAKALQNCVNLLDPELRNGFISLEKSLLRSPRAHKICVKSANPDIHVLYGEDKENFRRPLGKAFGKNEVKPWDYTLKALYFGFALVLPLILCGALFGFFMAMFSNTKYGPYLMAVPFVLALLDLHFFICVRFGRDERGSAIYRRMLGLDALIKAVLCLLYFILPSTFAFLAPVGIGLFIASAIEGLWGFFLYKDKKKAVCVPIYVVLLLVELAGLVFLILGLMNGTLG